MPSRSNENYPQPRPRRRQKQASPVLHVFGVIGKVLGTFLLVMLITGIILACFAMAYIKQVILPQAHLDANFDMNLTSTIYYMDSSTGQYVEHLSLHGLENRELVTYDQIPQNLINATIAIEDERFLTHNGVDWKRTLNGVLLMFTGKDIQGGSTITQQLIKNVTQYDDVTVKRKILEIFTALDFDATYSKEQIMEWYLNYIYLGDGCSGVATAAKNYFGKEVSEMSLAECASLISITNNPTLYGPNSSIRITNEKTGEVTTGRERNKERQELVLWKMKELNMISEQEYQEAVAEELVFTRSEDESKPTTIYNWYDEQVITDVINDLMEEKGYSQTLAENTVLSGGLKIYACVDTRIQSIVESVYYDQNSLKLPSKKGQDIQSSIVIIDPQGNVVGLAGALGSKDANRVLNMASGTVRQPGSSIKPLSVYAPAIELGLITPASVYADEPVRVLNGKNWPLNNPQTYRGDITVETALEVSSNPVAVRILEEMGAETSFNFVEENFHIDLEDYYLSNGEVKNDYGSSQLALGGLTHGVSVMDMAAAYSVFPRDGTYLEPRTYSKVTREVNGVEEVLLDNTNTEGEVILSTRTTYYMNEMLKNVVTSGTGTAARISGMTVAGKTGSTTANNDRWFVGYTPYYTAAVWVGYKTPERIYANNNPAAVMWQKVMSQVHEGLANKDFTEASGLTTVQICKDSGLRATDACRSDPRGDRVMQVSVFQEDAPAENCGSHVLVEVCTESPIVDADGNAVSGLYHLAGEFCPREANEAQGITKGTVTSIGVLTGNTGDSQYTKAYLESQGSCTVHTSETKPEDPTEYDPSTFRLEDQSTWPTQEQWPGFNPEDPSTYPTVSTEPSPPPTTEPTDTPEPVITPSPTPPPEETPSEEPYIPAGG